jgi:hypothetical protein
MGGKSSPRAPDPFATAQAQSQANADTARLQATMNRGNTFTPFGTVTNRQTWDEAGYLAANPDVAASIAAGAHSSGADHWRKSGQFENRGNFGTPDQWETRVTLSPEQQQIYDQGVQLDTQTGQIALDQIPRMRNLLSQDVQTNDLPAWMQDDPDARNRATTAILSRLEPQFERDRAALEGRLISQGFTPGTEAYARAADELSRARTDARLQADAAGMAESRAGASFNNNTRGGMLTERLQLRAQPINEIAALFGLGPGMQMPQQIQQQPVSVAGTDLAGMINSQYQQRLAQQGSNMGAIAGLGGAALGAALGSPWLGSAFGFGAQAATGGAGR